MRPPVAWNGVGSNLPEMPEDDRELIAVGLQLRPGYSGGPLVDDQGRLVGLNTMMIGPEVGVAVPVQVVKEFLRERLGWTASDVWVNPPISPF